MSETARCFRMINPPPEHTHITDPDTGEPVENPRAGEPQPFLGLGVSYAVPTMVGGEIVPVAQTAYVGAPGFLKAHRQALPSQLLPVEVSEDGQVITATGVAAQLLAEHDLFEECDPPKKTSGPTVAELRTIAEALGVDHDGLRKSELVEAIEDAQTMGPQPPSDPDPADENDAGAAGADTPTSEEG